MRNIPLLLFLPLLQSESLYIKKWMKYKNKNASSLFLRLGKILQVAFLKKKCFNFYSSLFYYSLCVSTPLLTHFIMTFIYYFSDGSRNRSSCH